MVAGARPNFIKVKPILEELDRRNIQSVFVHTGQHYDPQLSDRFLDELNIRQPDHHLGVGSGSHASQVAAVMVGLEGLMATIAPSVVIVVGDVNSTMAAALVTAKSPALLAHVEAGLRSRDWQMPEEINRVVTDRVSDFLFAPSEDAVVNLQGEGVDPDRIFLVGNVMIDTLLLNLERARERDIVTRLGVEDYALLTLHRPSNVDDSMTLQPLLDAVAEGTDGRPLIFPAHPRSLKSLRETRTPSSVRVIEPLGYLDFIALMDSAAVVLTDSGGVQEETTALGIPCVTLRNTTERPITVSEGTNRIAGTRPVDIVRTIREVLDNPPVAASPALWDGRAAERILDVLCSRTGHLDASTDVRTGFSST